MPSKPPPSPQRHDRPAYTLGLESLHNPGPMDTDELALFMGVSRHNANYYVRTWREEGLVYVLEWKHANEFDRRGDLRPIWALRLDYQSDAPRPKPMTSKQKRQRYTRRHRMRIKLKKAAKRGTLNMFTQLKVA